MKKIYLFNLAFIFVVAISIMSFAQEKTAGNNKFEAVASDVVGKLQQKILLSDKQTSEIKDIVVKYISVKANLSDSSKLISKITPLLDSRQKIKFEIIQNDWWSSIIKDLAEPDTAKAK